MPHLTIAKMDTTEEALKVLEVSRQRWTAYTDARAIRVSSLTLVKGSGERWVDLANVTLGAASAT